MPPIWYVSRAAAIPQLIVTRQAAFSGLPVPIGF